MKEKITKNWRILSLFLVALILIIIIFYFLFVFDIGINSSYFIKRDFDTALLARETGDCNLFKDYIYTDKDKWGELCIKEKDMQSPSIKGFSINKLATNGDSAFLQVNLKREILSAVSLQLTKDQIRLLEQGYVVNYDLVKDNSGKFLFLPRTRWLIKNEAR